jgi:SAM-dependent methyltransferase
MQQSQICQIRRGLGRFDEIRLDGGRLSAAGWLLDPEGGLDGVEAWWNGQPLGAVSPVDRPDVLAVHGSLPGAGRSGFRLSFEPEPWADGRLDLVGTRGEASRVRLSTHVQTPADRLVPLPPAVQMQRVSGVSGEAFVHDGLRMFTELMDRVVLHAGAQRPGRMLDWGCGVARVTRYFLTRRACGEVHGCDIDPEAVAWCQAHLPDGQFAHSGPLPPLPYADEAFDLVVGCSVFTHIAEREQLPWLQELQRVLAPGGLLLVSVLGQWAQRARRRPTLRELLSRLRSGARRALGARGAAAPASRSPHYAAVSDGRYRDAVYQRRERTLSAWGQLFEVVEYAERGLNGYQDLVVLRRPHPSPGPPQTRQPSVTGDH